MSKSPFLVYHDLSESNTLTLLAQPSKTKRKKMFIDYLKLHKKYPNSDIKCNIFADICNNVLLFCKTNQFSALKTSSLLSIYIITHDNNCENVNKALHLDDTYNYFEKQLLKHSVERPPFSIAIFTYPDIKKISRKISTR